MVVQRFDVYLVNLDPTVGSEIRKTRPCLIISPDEMNRWMRTVIVAPMTTKGQSYPTRACSVSFRGKKGRSYWIRFERLIDPGWRKNWAESVWKQDGSPGNTGRTVCGRSTSAASLCPAHQAAIRWITRFSPSKMKPHSKVLTYFSRTASICSGVLFPRRTTQGCRAARRADRLLQPVAEALFEQPAGTISPLPRSATGAGG